MSSEAQYRRDLQEAQKELARLVDESEKIETQIARTKRRIALLAELSGEDATAPDLDLGGLTDACETALRASRKEWMNTTEIMSALKELGFPIANYKAPMASITTTVNRMVESGEVVSSPRTNPGATEYKWVGFRRKNRIRVI